MGFDRTDGYRAQDALVGLLEDRMGDRVGWKLGLTGSAVTGDPIAGPIHSGMVVADGGTIALDDLITPRIEVELALIVDVDVDRPVTASQLAAMPMRAAAAFEVIDDRTTGVVGPPDWIADWATMSHILVGAARPLPDPLHVAGTLAANDVAIATGDSQEIIGDCLRAVSWLTRHLSSRDLGLSRGDVILTGSLTGQHQPGSGDRYLGTVQGCAPVSVEFA